MSRYEHIEVENRLKTVVLSVRLPVDLAKVLHMRARHEHTTISALMLAIIEASIDPKTTTNSGWPFEVPPFVVAR